MEKIVNNYKMLYTDILKRVKLHLEDAHKSDLKFHKSNKKVFSLTRTINQINKISFQEVKEFEFDNNLNFILLPNNYDFHYFGRLLLVNIINKNNVVFVKKNKKDSFLLEMLIAISNSFASEFKCKSKLFFLNNKIIKGSQYNIKVEQFKTKQKLLDAKSKRCIFFI